LETIIELFSHSHGNERIGAETADRNSGNNGQKCPHNMVGYEAF